MTQAEDPPRSRRILRLIAAERAIRGVLLIAASIYLFNHLHSDFGRISDHIMRAIELDPRRPVPAPDRRLLPRPRRQRDPRRRLRRARLRHPRAGRGNGALARPALGRVPDGDLDLAPAARTSSTSSPASRRCSRPAGSPSTSRSSSTSRSCSGAGWRVSGLPGRRRLQPAVIKRFLRVVAGALQQFFADQCSQQAAGIAYRLLFSMAPLAIVLVSIFGLILQDDSGPPRASSTRSSTRSRSRPAARRTSRTRSPRSRPR